MLHLIPAPLHRRLYRLADWGRRKWWRIRKPRRSSVIMMALDEQGRVLLVRHSYGRPVWTLPGGGLGRREEPEAAAIREFREELGCAITDLRPLVTSEEPIAGSLDRQHVFVAQLGGTPIPDMREIVAVQMADPAELPANTGVLTRRRLAQWLASQ